MPCWWSTSIWGRRFCNRSFVGVKFKKKVVSDAVLDTVLNKWGGTVTSVFVFRFQTTFRPIRFVFRLDKNISVQLRISFILLYRFCHINYSISTFIILSLAVAHLRSAALFCFPSLERPESTSTRPNTSLIKIRETFSSGWWRNFSYLKSLNKAINKKNKSMSKPLIARPQIQKKLFEQDLQRKYILQFAIVVIIVHGWNLVFRFGLNTLLRRQSPAGPEQPRSYKPSKRMVSAPKLFPNPIHVFFLTL